MKKHPEPISFKFVIRRSASESLRLGSEGDGWSVVAGHQYVAILRPSEVEAVATGFVNSVLWDERSLDNLTIICPLKGRVPVEAVLDAVRGHATGEANLDLYGARVSAKLLDRILGEWESVNLAGCALEQNWWRAPRGPRRCKQLRFRDCTTHPAPNLTSGCASWPELSLLFADEAVWDPTLAPEGAYPPEAAVRHDAGYPAGVSQLVQAFFGPEVQDLSVSNAREISRLADLPDSRNLRELELSESPMTEAVLRWISRQKSIRSLVLSWHPEVRPLWKQLGNLSKLRSMDVTGSRFSDSDLADLAAHTRLRTLYAFYTKLTAQSWPLILSMPDLKQVWVSTEMLEGPIPNSMPATTGVREVVALNVGAVHLEYLKGLLKPYPAVKIAEM